MERPPIVYANRTAWYPHPPNEDFATARMDFETPEGWLAVTGGELVSSRTAAGRTRSEYRLAEPGKYLTVVVGRLAEVGLRQEGPQSVRSFSAAAHAPRDARGDGRDPGAAGLLREAVRAVALPDAGPGGGRGRDAGRPQPARAALPADAASDPALASAGRGPRELLRPAGLLPGARGGAPVVGPGPGPGQLPRALAVRGLGAVRGGALAARAARRADLPHDDGPHGDVGVAPRRHRPDPPRPAARPPQGRAALLSSGGLRQGRLGAAHAARADGRPGVLRGRARVPRKVSLREGGHRRPARRPRNRERAGLEALLRPLGLRHRPAEPRLDRQHRLLPARVSARPSR